MDYYVMRELVDAIAAAHKLNEVTVERVEFLGNGARCKSMETMPPVKARKLFYGLKVDEETCQFQATIRHDSGSITRTDKDQRGRTCHIITIR